MLNRDFATTTANIAKTTNITPVEQINYANILDNFRSGYKQGQEQWEKQQLDTKKKAYIDALQSGDQEKIDEALADYNPEGYANVMTAREKRQQELEDWDKEAAFKREMVEAELKNSIGLENLKHQHAMGLALFKKANGISADGTPLIDPKFTMDLRKEFQAGAKDYYSVGDNYAKLQKANENPSAAGDISMVFSYMKMLDPGSVVREGEYANAQNAAGVPTRIVNAYNRLLDGTRLSNEQREDFTNQGRNLYEAQKQRFDKQKDFYTNIARASNIDPQYVISDPFDFEQNPQGLASFQAPQSGGMVQIKAPDGRIVAVPESEVQNALSQGGQRL